MPYNPRLASASASKPKKLNNEAKSCSCASDCDGLLDLRFDVKERQVAVYFAHGLMTPILSSVGVSGNPGRFRINPPRESKVVSTICNPVTLKPAHFASPYKLRRFHYFEQGVRA
jgi:hypothetical protein